MKKALSVFLAVTLFISVIPWAVFASADHDLENAILTAKSKIEIPEEYSEFTSNIYTDYGETSYNLRWTTKDEEYTRTKQISINVNSYNDITSYDCSDYTSYSNKLQFPKFTDEEFKNAAKEWLFSVNPSWEKSLPDDAITVEGINSISSSTVTVEFKRIENGLPFCNDQASISINDQTKEISSFYSTWTYPDSIPDPSEAIDEATAQEIFYQKSPMELKYMYTSRDLAILVYTPTNENVVIDARTGEEFNFFQYRQSNSKAASGGSNLMTEESADAASPEAPRLTENELKNIDEVENLLTENELHNIAKNLPNTSIKDLTLISVNYSRIKWGERPQYKASLCYENTNPGKYGRAYVYLDAQTGELFNFNCYTDRNADEKNKVSFDTALKTAESFIKQYGGKAANKVKNITETPTDTEKLYEYYYTFSRFENDIPYHENYFLVSIDPVTGNITNYTKKWTNKINFESADELISPEKAGKILVDAEKLVLSYDFQQGDSTTKPIIGMTYRLGNSVPRIIKAQTGEIIDYGGSLYTPEENEIIYPEDITGHYGEAAITKLFESGLISFYSWDEPLFYPDNYITQEELITLLCHLDYGAPQPIYSDIVARKINNYKKYDITIEPDSTASREFGVMLMVTALNYQETAKLKGIYTTAFADQNEISEDMLGFVALAQGLGIISGNGNGLFKPKEALTRADAAIMIYNYLSR